MDELGFVAGTGSDMLYELLEIEYQGLEATHHSIAVALGVNGSIEGGIFPGIGAVLEGGLI
jgi:hypothetical protein